MVILWPIYGISVSLKQDLCFSVISWQNTMTLNAFCISNVTMHTWVGTKKYSYYVLQLLSSKNNATDYIDQRQVWHLVFILEWHLLAIKSCPTIFPVLCVELSSNPNNLTILHLLLKMCLDCFFFPLAKVFFFASPDGSVTEPDMNASFCPEHKSPMVLFLDRVYGIEDQSFLLNLLEVGFLPDFRVSASLDTVSGSPVFLVFFPPS